MSNGQSIEDGEQLSVIGSGLIPTNELPSTLDTPSSQPLLYVENHTRRQQPTMVKPKRLTAKDRHTATNCPKWVVLRKQIIWYKCYKIDSHLPPECLAKFNDMDSVVHNYEKLTDKSKPLIPADSYSIAKKYSEMECEVATNQRSSDEQPLNESKN